jgi:hypothetical protein
MSGMVGLWEQVTRTGDARGLRPEKHEPSRQNQSHECSLVELTRQSPVCKWNDLERLESIMFVPASPGHKTTFEKQLISPSSSFRGIKFLRHVR